jgi:hypothetical protein
MKLGSFAPVEATPEHAAEQLASDVAERGGVGQAGPEHRHLVLVSRECHQLRGFRHLRRRARSAGSPWRWRRRPTDRSGANPARLCASDRAGGPGNVRRNISWVCRPAPGRAPTCHARRRHARHRAGIPSLLVAPWSRTSGLGPLRHSWMLNAISTDEELIDDLGND